MLNRIVTTAVIFLLVAAGHAQSTFFKTYGGDLTDEGWDVQQTSDGGYIIAGMTRSFGPGYSAVYLIKTDVNGETLWTRTYGGNSSNSGFCVDNTADHGFIIIGLTNSVIAGNRGIYMVKTDQNGDTLWTRAYGIGIGWAGQQTINGGYVITGHNYQSGIIIKTDAPGDTRWTRIFDEDVMNRGRDIQQTTDGGYILTGEMHGLAALVKTDSLGHLQWFKHSGAKRLDRGYSVRQTTDGGYVFTGIQYVPGGHESSSRALLVKTNASGDTLWTRKLGENPSCGNCVRQTTDGGYIITGYENGHYIILIKTDKNGEQLWKECFGIGMGNSVRQINDGGYIVTGMNVDADVFLLKTDESGTLTSVEENTHNNIVVPHNFTLYQNIPNPFNQSTKISYEVNGHMQDVKLVIYDITGKEVITLIDEAQQPGLHRIQWDGRDKKGGDVPSGTYFCKLQMGGNDVSITKKILLIR